MCTSTKQNKFISKKKETVQVRNGWRIQALFRIEKLIREVGQDSRAKRMGICGNTIFVKVNPANPENILFEPQVRSFIKKI